MSEPSAALLLEHGQFLRRIARALLHDPDAAEDVVQETLVAALRHPPPANTRGWLGKVARHLALSRRRAEARRERREREAARPEALPSAAEGVARLELQRQVVDAVLALDEPYRSVVVHRFFFDLTPTEVARRLGVPVETVRTRLRRALDQLRARLDASRGRHAWSTALLAIAAPRKPPLGVLVTMSMKTKLIAASVLVLACAALGVSALARRDAPPQRAPLPSREEVRETAPPPDLPVPPVDPATIDRDLDVHGFVVDETGGAVAGADVRVLRYPAMGVAVGLAQMEVVEGPGTRTASDGSFALRLSRGEEVDLRVAAAGFVTLQRRWCPAGGKVRIVMRRGVSLRVTAKGPDGKPLAGAHVILFKGKDPEMEALGIYTFLEGMTGAEGTCVLSDLLPGREVQVVAWHPDVDYARPVPVRLPEAGEAQAELVAVRGRDVTGRVTDAATGAPVAGAVVTPYPFLVPFAKAVGTDADGRYRYGGWGSERALFVHARGYASGREEVGDRSEIDFALTPGTTLTGVVRDTSGGPVAGAFVGAYATDRSEMRETRSGADGRFALADLNRARVLVAAKAGFARAQQEIEAKEVEIVLREGHRLEGRVLGLDGELLEGVTVQATPGVEGTLQFGMPERYERHTDDLGRFRFTDMPAGTVHLSATADERKIGREVTIAEGDVTDVEMRFERGREFTVLVTDETGQPVPGVLVTSNSGRKTTDAQGRVAFEMPNGVAIDQVIVRNEDARFVTPPAATVRLGQPETRIVLLEAAPVSGQVLLEGKPLARAVCWVHGPDRFSWTGLTDEAGKFTFGVPARTRVDLGVTGQVLNEMLPIYGELNDVAAGSDGLVLEVHRVPLDRTLVVRVVTPDGKGVPDMQVYPQDARGWRPAPAGPGTDASGKIEFTGLPAAEIFVNLFSHPPAPWAQAKPRTVKVVPNGQEIVFTLRESKPIRGVVRGPDGAGVRGWLTAWRGEEAVASGTSAEDGTFALYIAADEPEPVRLEAGATGLHATLEGVVPGSASASVELKAR